MADIREEDFTRMQAQIIELRTANYDTEVKYQRQNNELEQLREKCSQIERELEKSSKIIQKSKNKKEYALLLEENESLQHQLRDHEEDFKLQNKTLLEEVTRVEDENKKLIEEVKNLKSGKEGDAFSSHEAELRRLKAENAVLQKSLKSTQASFEAEPQNVIDGENLQTAVSKQPNADDDGQSTGENLTTEKAVQDPQSILNEIIDEFTKQINLTFETFFHDFGLKCKTTEEQDVQSPDNNGSETTLGDNNASETTLGDKNGDEIRHCTLDQVENLNEKIQSKISTLLQDKVVTLKLKNENYEETNLKPSTQLTEIQLQLATEREEKNILEEQLVTLEGNLRKDISRLEEEVSKLTEKAKKKQESFIQLQNEKENLYNENRKTIEDMKIAHSNEIKKFKEQITQSSQDLDAARKELADNQQTSENKVEELEKKLLAQESQATSNVEETIQELDNARIENSSLCEQLQSLQEACESYRIENEDQKAMLITMQDKMKQMEDKEITLKADNDKLKSEIEESSLSYEHLRRQVDETMGEKEQYIQSANEAAKLAEKRKQILDEFSIDQQKLVAEHKEQLERLETSYKDEAKKTEDEFKRTIEDLKTQLQGEKKLKKDLEESQQHLSDVTSQLTSVESKCGWFERRLAETEENLSQEKANAVETIEEIKKEHESNMNETTARHEAELQKLNEKLEAVEAEKQEQQNVIEKYKQEIKDKDVENVIAGKKGDHLMKDLKRQLKMERKKTEQLQQRLQEACSENRARENFEKLFDPNVSKEYGRRNSGDSSMLSGSSLTNESHDTKEPSPDSSFNTSVNDETADLISRVADIQQEKWQLEERVRHLEENGSAMADDLMRKNAVIQHYAMEAKFDNSKDISSPQESNFKSRMKGTFNIGKQEILLKDMNKKLQNMLEETLMKNIQLQKDIDILADNQRSNTQEHSSNRSNEADKT
ncbi:GRIP1-associated protein 1-like [Dendronephthya gigantea]|uniref:GRIP1-associated protein 1-like n=1 Tax=Dendronephthya gigantea TaxID=151771 RepID=UPI00106BE0CF|nr:GRIP1-associated protein 1-like [Dendronephthya gigantea]